ncbi:MAG: TlpA family protein disulfide reductase [Planctomycetes bacterium]|nr:TlpA family protein disulfide reductase [Planctomycetota bacterium]
MRILPSLVSLLLASSAALAQGDPATAPSMPGAGGLEMPAMPMTEPLSKNWTAEETSPEAAAKGSAALTKLVSGYTTPAAIEDKVEIIMSVPGGDQKQELGIAFGPDGTARLTAPGVTVTRIGDDLFFEPGEVKGKYLKITRKGSLEDAISEAFGSAALPLPEIQLRGGKAAEAPAALGSMFVAEPKVVGFRAGANGGSDVVLLKGEGGGEIEASIHPTNGRLVIVKYLAVPPGAPEGFSIPITLNVTSTSFDKDLPSPIAFDPAGRKAVSSMDKLQVSLDTGSAAPTFKLKDTDGTEVDLEALKGSVVVIDFWATWCGPCMKGLPKVDEFAKWAKEGGKAVKVFGVNTMEQEEGDERVKKIGEFWKKKGFAFATLIDADNKVSGAYGVQGIPFTVVIDPAGNVADVHMGLSPSLVEDLKKATEAALAAKKG